MSPCHETKFQATFSVTKPVLKELEFTYRERNEFLLIKITILNIFTN